MRATKRGVCILIVFSVLFGTIIAGLAAVTAHAANSSSVGTRVVYATAAGATSETSDAKHQIKYTFTYEIGNPSAAADAVNNTAVITGIEMPNNEAVNLTVPSKISVTFTKEELTAMGFTTNKNAARTLTVVGVGNVSELSLWDRFSIFFKNLFNINNSLFTKAEGLEDTVYPTSVTIPSTIESIGNSAFSGATTLRTLSFGSGSKLSEIGPFAFYNTNIETLTLNTPSLTEIPESAFAGSGSLTSVSISSANVSKIGPDAFADCGDKLDSFTISTNGSDLYIDGSAFSGDSHLATVTLGHANNTSKITLGSDVLFDDTAVRTVTLNCGTIEDNGAFQELSQLNTVSLGKITAIPDGIFMGSNIGQNDVTNTSIFECSNCGYENSSTADVCPGCEAAGDDLEWINVTSITGSRCVFTIPATVTSIGENAFKDCKYIHAIGNGNGVLPNSITSIGKGAFEGCEWLEQVSWPKDMSYVPENAYKNCKNLKKFTFATNTVCEDIRKSAFEECESLETILFGSKANIFPTSLGTIGEKAFYGCVSLCRADGTLTSGTATTAAQLKANANARLDNRTGLQSVGNKAFKNCLFLMNFKLYNGSCSLSDDVFDSGTFIFSVVDSPVNRYANDRKSRNIFFADIYDAKTSMIDGSSGDLYWTYDPVKGILTFYGQGMMKNYTKTSLPEWHRYAVVKVVWSGSAYKVPADSTVKINGTSVAGTTVKAAAPTNIGAYAFYECDRLTDTKSMPIPGKVTSIGEYAFAECTNLKSIDLRSNAITSIGDYAFYDCASLSDFVGAAIGSVNLDKIGKYAFAYTAAKARNLTVRAAKIDESAFENCKDITVLTINGIDSVTIGKRAFADCTGLVTFTAAPKLKLNVYPTAFTGDFALSTVTFGESGKTKNLAVDVRQASNVFQILSDWIADAEPVQIFTGAPIKTLNIFASDIRYDENGPFTGSEKLESVKLGDLTSIPDGMFAECNALSKISLPATVTRIGNSAFAKCGGIVDITIPVSVVAIGESAFSECESLTSVTFAKTSNCESIGDYAFYECVSLRTVTGQSKNWLPNSLKTIGEAAFYNSGVTTLTSGVSTPKDQLGNRTGLTKIGPRAFGMCSGLVNFKLYNGSCDIDSLSFDREQVLYSVVGSPAETFANRNSLIFVDIYDTKDKVESGEISSANLLWSYNRDTGELALSPINVKAKVTDQSVDGGASVVYYVPNFSANNPAPWSVYKISSINIKNGNLSSIGNYAFYNCSLVNKFAVPANTKRIGNRAFANASQLSSLTFASGSNSLVVEDYAFTNAPLTSTTKFGARVLTIGEYAFGNLMSTNLTFTAARIKPHAFENCYSLEYVTILGSNTVIDEYAFKSDLKLYAVTLKSTGNCSISSAAFEGDELIDTVTIDGGANASWTVKSSPEGGSTELFSDSAENIYVVTLNCKLDDSFAGVFSGCRNLYNVTFGKDFDYLPDSLFENDAELAVIKNNSAVMRSIGKNAFKGCKLLPSFDISRDTVKVGESAFEDCVSLKTVAFKGTKLTEISARAFKNCESLTNVGSKCTLPDNIETVGDEAFYGTDLPYIVSGSKKDKGLTTIGRGAFGNCPSFTYAKLSSADIRFGDNKAFDDYTFIYGYVDTPLQNYVERYTKWIFFDITKMNKSAVTGTSGDLTWIYTPTTGALVFSGEGRMADYPSVAAVPWSKYNILSVNFSTKQTNVGKYAFAGCDALSKVTIRPSINVISPHAFEGCGRLVSFSVPAAVTSVGDYAFKDCTGLKEVKFDRTSNCTKIGDSAFENCTSLAYVTGDGVKEYLPVSVETLGKRAFYGCESLAAMRSGKKQGEGLKTVGENAFTGCSSLYDIYLWNNFCKFADHSVDYDIIVYSVPHLNGLEGWCNDHNVMFMDIRDNSKQAAITGYSDDLTWTYDVRLRTLTFTVTNGVKKKVVNMADYSSPTAAPWSRFRIKEVIFPSSRLFNVGNYAFTGQESLQRVSVPKSVSVIGDYAFYGCRNLQMDKQDRFGTKFIENIASRTTPVTFGEKALQLTPRVYEDVNLAGAPTVKVEHSVMQVDDIEKNNGAEYNDDFGRDGIGKVTVKLNTQGSIAETSGKDYVLLIDNTLSMESQKFCSGCGACLTAGSHRHAPDCPGADIKTMWTITKEQASEFVDMILTDNPDNRICILTMNYREESHREFDSKIVVDPADQFEYTSYGTWEVREGVDYAYLAADFTGNKSTLTRVIKNMETDKAYGTVAYRKVTWRWESERSYSGRPNDYPHHAPKGPGGGGGGGGGDEGGSSGGGDSYNDGPPSHVHAKVDKKAAPHKDKFIDLTPMRVSAANADVGTDYHVGEMGAILTVNNRQAPYSLRPVDFVFISDGEPLSHRTFAKATGAVVRHFFDHSFTMGLCTSETAKTFLGTAATLATQDVVVDTDNDGVGEVIISKGKPYTFMMNTDNMETIFHKYLQQIYYLSSATAGNVVMSNKLNTELWHLIRTADDIEGNGDGHILNPERYALNPNYDVSDDGSVITKDFRKMSNGYAADGSSFSYYIQLNESERNSSKYLELKNDLLVTEYSKAEYTVLGGAHSGEAGVAEDETPRYLWWQSSYRQFAIKYIVGADIQIDKNRSPEIFECSADPSVPAVGTIRYLKDLASLPYDTAYDSYKWTTAPSGRGGTVYEPGSEYIMPDTAFMDESGVMPTSFPDGVTWDARNNRPVLTLYLAGVGSRVYYDGLVDSASLYGVYDDAAEYYVNVATGNYVDTDTNDYWASRLGWDFMGWTEMRDSTDIVAPNTLVKSPLDMRIYAAYKRDLTLKLRSDLSDFEPVDVKPADIHNFETAFKFVDDNFKGITTMEDSRHKVTFVSNDGSELTDTGSLEINDSGETFVPVKFLGWYSAQKDGVLVGGSGTEINVEVHEGEPHRYTVKGDAGTAEMTSADRTLTLYARHSTNTLRLPGSIRNSDKFLGWFTQPQPEDGTTGFGGRFVGKAGDVVIISSDLVLHPWFNIPPNIIESELGSELHKGPLGDGFFEGQMINYSQLLALITASDTDNPFEATPEYGTDNTEAPDGYDGYIEWNGTKRWLDLYALNAEAYLDDLDSTYGWNLSDDDKAAILANVNDAGFWPTLTGITYYEDGLDSNGDEYPAGVSNEEVVQDRDSILSRGLITDMAHVGKIVLHYEITDNGTFANGVKIMAGKVNPHGGTFAIDSPITVGFDLVTYVNFNHPPKLVLTSTYMYTGDETITIDNIEPFLWKKQDAADRCDDSDRKPWWYVSETGPALDESIKIMEVYDIHFSSGFEISNSEDCEKVKAIKDIKKLFELKETNYELFKHITDFKIEWDCVDQWGKTASGYLMPGFKYSDNPNLNTETIPEWKPGDIRPELPGGQKKYGQDKPERSTTVIMFNNEDDYDLLNGNVVVSERMRYIDHVWSDYLNQDSYWGDSSKYGGKKTLQKIFENYRKNSGGRTVKGTFTNNGKPVNIVINDFSN